MCNVERMTLLFRDSLCCMLLLPPSHKKTTITYYNGCIKVNICDIDFVVFAMNYLTPRIRWDLIKTILIGPFYQNGPRVNSLSNKVQKSGLNKREKEIKSLTALVGYPIFFRIVS
jgi:hypothetical protein